MRFVVLSSSRGTTFQAILDRIADGALTAECAGLVADREDRGCVAKAKAAGIPVVIVEKREGPTSPDGLRGAGEPREVYDERLHEALLTLGSVDVIAAIGWMFVLSPAFIRKWKNRILNVHPALLPNYGGSGMHGDHVHGAVLKAREKESGMTIHLIDEGIDTGKILLQKKCPVLSDDTPETLKVRVQELEKEWYPKVLEMIERRELSLEV